MEQRAEHPPIELVAAKLRDLRQTAGVMAASPDVVGGVDHELQRVTVEYDRWLVIAAQQVEVGISGFTDDGTGLPADVRRHLEHQIRRQGWQLDG